MLAVRDTTYDTPLSVLIYVFLEEYVMIRKKALDEDYRKEIHREILNLEPTEE